MEVNIHVYVLCVSMFVICHHCSLFQCADAYSNAYSNVQALCKSLCPNVQLLYDDLPVLVRFCPGLWRRRWHRLVPTVAISTDEACQQDY